MIIREIRLGALILIACFAYTASAQSQLQNLRSDTQSWNEVEFTLPVNEQIDLTLSGTLRLGRNLGDFID